MTDDQFERYGKAWEAGEREDRACALCGEFIQPAQWMHYHYNVDGSRAVEHVGCVHKDQHAHYLPVTPLNAGRPPHGEAREWAPSGTRGLNVPGSPEWCWQTINLLKTYYQYVGNGWQEVLVVLAELAEHRAWEKVPTKKPYGSEDELLKAELGISRRQKEDLDRLLADHCKPQDQ